MNTMISEEEYPDCYPLRENSVQELLDAIVDMAYELRCPDGDTWPVQRVSAVGKVDDRYVVHLAYVRVPGEWGERVVSFRGDLRNFVRAVEEDADSCGPFDLDPCDETMSEERYWRTLEIGPTLRDKYRDQASVLYTGLQWLEDNVREDVIEAILRKSNTP